MEDRTAEQLAQDYTAMGHSVDLINDIVAGNQDDEMEAADRQGCVDRNVAHLEIMVGKDDWGKIVLGLLDPLVFRVCPTRFVKLILLADR